MPAFGAIFGAKTKDPPKDAAGDKASTNGSTNGASAQPAGAVATREGTPSVSTEPARLEYHLVSSAASAPDTSALEPTQADGPKPESGLNIAPGQVLEIREINVEILKLIPEWNTKPHKHISFRGKVKRTREYGSDDGAFVFNLETLDGLVRLSRRHPSEKDKINLTKLESLDVSENVLRDINGVQGTQGFSSLRVLKARKNCLLKFAVNLPTLRELDLSHNRLKELPPTSGMPELEVLVIAHNLMNGLWEPLRNLKDLKKLDISNNRFDPRPSDLGIRLAVLEGLPHLTSLRLKDNPFSRLFPEYQSVVLSRLPGLQKLDDISGQDMEEFKQLPSQNKMNVKDLAHYDTLVFSRGKADRMHVTQKDQNQEKETSVPSFQEISAPLNNALQDHDPDNVHRAIKELKRLCDKVYMADKDHITSIWREMQQEHAKESGGEKGPSTSEVIDSAIDHLTDNIKILYSRIADHPGQRVMLIRCLAKLGKVHLPAQNGLGERSLDLLGWLMKKDAVSEKEVLDSVKEIIVRPLMYQNSLDSYCLHQIRALAKFESPRLPEALSPIAEWLARQYSNYGASPQQDITTLLAVATKSQSNTEHALALHDSTSSSAARETSGSKSDGLPAHVILALENKTLIQNESLREQYINHLTIVGNTARHGGPRVVDVYEENMLHRELVKNLKTFFDDCPIQLTQPYNRVNPPRKTVDLTKLKVLGLRTCAALLDAITALMAQKHDILQDLCDAKPPSGVPVVEYYSIAVRAPTADPVLLASSMHGLKLILKEYSLENALARNEMMNLIINDVQKMTTMLHYLDPEHIKYKRLWQMAEKHLAERSEGGSKSVKAELGQAPKLTALTNPLMHLAFEAIVGVVEFFTDMKEKSKICDAVSKAMDGAQRERLLFRLLKVNSDGVRDAVMACLAKVDSSELDSEEVGFLIQLLDSTKDLTAEDALLCKVIDQLTTFANESTGSGGAGAALKADHAEHSIESVMNILVKNERRNTYGDAREEEQKTELSKACVEFLQAASNWHEIRDSCMRSKLTNGSLVDALKYEDDLHAPTSADVCAERTWTGRSVETLMQCFTGKEKLKARGKVAFRILVRVADILEGRSDSIRTEEEITCMTLANEELKMWDEAKTKRELKMLGDPEMHDRRLQHRIFGDYNGIDRVVQFLTGLNQDENKRAEARKFQQVVLEKATKFLGKVKDDAENKGKKTEDDSSSSDSDSDDDDGDDDDAQGPFLVYQPSIEFDMNDDKAPPQNLGKLLMQTGLGKTAFNSTFGGALSIAFTARFDMINDWGTLIDFGNGDKQDNITIRNKEKTMDLEFMVVQGNGAHIASLVAPNGFVCKETHEFLFTVSDHGAMRIWRDGTILNAILNGKAPKVVKRKFLHVGSTLSDMDGNDGKFDGNIANIRVWKGEKQWDVVKEDGESTEFERKLLMKVLQSVDYDTPRVEKPELMISSSLGTNVPRDMQVREEFFVDSEKGTVNMAFPIVAMLRCCYALLKVPAVEAIRVRMTDSLKDSLMVTQLLSLVQLCSPFDCRVAAKFLRLMSSTLQLPQSELSEKVEVVVLYDVLSSYFASLCRTVVNAIKQQDDMNLQLRGRELSLEIVRLATVMVHNVPLCQIDATKEGRDEFDEKVISRLMPVGVIKSFLQMALSGQIDEKQGGKNPDSDKEKKAIGEANNQIWELLRILIAAVLDKCQKMKYDILMVFSGYMVTGSKAMRQSFLAGLLQQMKQSEERAKIQAAFGEMVVPVKEPILPMRGHSDTAEKTVAFARCEVILNGARRALNSTSAPHPFLAAVVTNKNLLIIDASKPGYPQNPSVVEARPLSDITRIVRGVPSQVVYVGWMKKIIGVSDNYDEEYMVIICHRESDRKLIIGALHELSIPKGGSQEHRVPLQMDNTFKKALENQVTEQMLMISFANSLNSDYGDYTLKLYVLSETQLYEFHVKFENWAPGAEPEDADTDSGAEDSDDGGAANNQAEKKKKGGKTEEVAALGGKSSPDLEACLEICRQRKKARDKSDGSPGPAEGGDFDLIVASHAGRQLTTLEKVAFYPDKRPKMCLTFTGTGWSGSKEAVTMIFFDDMSRETWRQAVIGQLQKQDQGGGKWVKSYKSGKAPP